MENDFIILYKKQYERHLFEIEQILKNKMSKFDFDEPCYENLNIILKELEEKAKNSIAIKEPFAKLTSFYKNKSMRTAEKKYKVIPKYLLPMYKEVLNRDLKLTFQEYVKELAIYNAKSEASRIFHLMYGLLRLMYEIEDFSEFKLDEKFTNENTLFYEKYRKLVYEKDYDEKESINGVELNKTNITKELEVNNFNLTPKFIKVFKKREFYDDLVKNDFFDKEKTRLEDFKNVFFKKFTEHNSTINFFDDDKALYLLKYLGKKKRGQISQTDISDSKRFRKYDEKIVNQSAITNSYKKLLPQEISQIEFFINSHLK